MPGRRSRARENRTAPAAAGDFYPTPAPITAALLARELLTRQVWEPACGDGAMARVIRDAGYEVHSSDLHDRGFGVAGVDFLAQRDPRGMMLPGDFSVVTNPPFSLAGPFARHALDLGARKVCLFVRCAFLEGQERHASLFTPDPPARFWVFSRRQTLWRGNDPEARARGGAMAFAWAVWERHHRGGPMIGWLP